METLHQQGALGLSALDHFSWQDAVPQIDACNTGLAAGTTLMYSDPLLVTFHSCQ